ncbi:hypothetical protein QR680_001926 [Steinernema hermaphroditum]|uniref:EGF-like domain-containing protein n=1 Tax=Steinernema hermaphroditum TaxID=289476 RepID=A0AA39H0K6_9BILA|nr:hypothetical protein QR680_001926 [Steinernema hermaphroditum]
MYCLADLTYTSPTATLASTTSSSSTNVTPGNTTPSSLLPVTTTSPTPMSKCQNDGLEYCGQCHCSSKYIGPEGDASLCNNYECLNYGILSNGVCHCPPGFLGFHCEPVRCVSEQLHSVARPQSLSLYVSWNFALKSSFDYVNETFYEFSKNHTDVTINIMFNEDSVQCSTPKCVAEAFQKNHELKQPSEIPIERIRQLVDISDFQSHVIIWTDVALAQNNPEELNELLQVAIAKRVKISAYVYRPNLKVHQGCISSTAYLCDDFKDLRRVVNSTLGVFLAPYRPLPIATTFTNETLSSLSEKIVSSQYAHTVLSTAGAASCSNIFVQHPMGISNTTYLALTSLSDNAANIMEYAGGTADVVANAGRWILFKLKEPGTILTFKDNFPCYYEVWAVDAKDSLSVGFTSNPDADVTSTVPFTDFQQNLIVLLYTGDDIKSAQVELIRGDNVASLDNGTETQLAVRQCQYNYLVPYKVQCSNEGESQITITLNGGLYSEVVPLYCSKPFNDKYFPSLSVDQFDYDYEFDQDSTNQTSTAEVSTTATATTETKPVPQTLCPEPNANRTFALVLANDYHLVQSLFNVSDRSSLMKPLLTYLQNVPYSNYAIGFLNDNSKCLLKSATDLRGFKNILLNNIVDSKASASEWDFAECIKNVLNDASVQSYSDLFVITPNGIGKSAGYGDTLKAIYSKRITVTTISQNISDCHIQTAGDNMGIMALSTLSGGFAMCSPYTAEIGMFISNYHTISNTPSVFINMETSANNFAYTTQSFYVANDSDFIFSTTCTAVCLLTVDNSTTPISPFSVTTSMAFFSVNLTTGMHSLSIQSAFTTDIMYKLSILGEETSDLRLAFEAETLGIQPYLTYGNGVNPVIGGNLSSNFNLAVTVTTKDSIVATNVPFNSDINPCFPQKLESSFICNDDYKIYYLEISSENFTTRTYPFACVPSEKENICVHGELISGKCACYPGWKLPHCAEPEICLNGGTPVSSSCKCPQYFHGTQCEKYSGECEPTDVAETLRYDSQFGTVTIVVQDDIIPQLASLKNLNIGFARQYTLVRFSCDTNCSVCSLFTNDRKHFTELFNKDSEAVPKQCKYEMKDPLEVALDTQISTRGLLIFIANNATFSDYAPTNTVFRLAAKRRAEIRFVSINELPDDGKLKSISLNPVVKYDANYFDEYINGILPTTNSSDKALYVVTRGSEDLEISAQSDSVYFLSFAKDMPDIPVVGAKKVSDQIFVVNASSLTEKKLNIVAKGIEYTVEELTTQKIAFALNRDVHNEEREFGIIATKGSYFNFYSSAVTSENVTIVSFGNFSAMATRKSTKNCHYKWTSFVTCDTPGIKSVTISWITEKLQHNRTIDVFCIPESSDLCSTNHSNETDNGCVCDSNWSDIDCSRPSCNGGILDGTVCNCKFPLFGDTCSSPVPTSPAPTSTSTLPATSTTSTSSTTVVTTTIRPKSCVFNVNITLFLFYDASNASEPYIDQYRSIFKMLVSDFNFGSNNSYVALYDMTDSRPSAYESLCSNGMNIDASIKDIRKSPAKPGVIQNDLSIINRLTNYIVNKGCQSYKPPKSIYVVYLASGSYGSGSNVNASVKEIKDMEGKIIPIVVPFSQTGSFWQKFANQTALESNHDVVYFPGESDSDHRNLVDQIWTRVCLDSHIIDSTATALPPASSELQKASLSTS